MSEERRQKNAGKRKPSVFSIIGGLPEQFVGGAVVSCTLSMAVPVKCADSHHLIYALYACLAFSIQYVAAEASVLEQLFTS
jgi:hypothetical protein